MIEDIRPWQILRQFADEDHWTNEGYCGVCGGEVIIRESNSNGQQSYYGESKPNTHTYDCPWLRAQRLVVERYNEQPKVSAEPGAGPTM